MQFLCYFKIGVETKKHKIKETEAWVLSKDAQASPPLRTWPGARVAVLTFTEADPSDQTNLQQQLKT